MITKNISLEKIREAYEAGARDFGENRVQEFLAKVGARHASPLLPSDIRWHLVGHLQTNKVRTLLDVGADLVSARLSQGQPQGLPLLLHSLDRVPLAEEIEKQAEKKNRRVDALIQVNTSGEATKSGFAPDEAEAGIKEIEKMNRIKLRGLMTIGPLAEDEIRVRGCFRKLRNLRDELQKKFSCLDLTHLSMGMSSDFEIAVEEGATLVRIGTAVFGERK